MPGKFKHGPLCISPEFNFTPLKRKRGKRGDNFLRLKILGFPAKSLLFIVLVFFTIMCFRVSHLISLIIEKKYQRGYAIMMSPMLGVFLPTSTPTVKILE